MIVSKKKKEKFEQNQYDQFFRKIEYNLREMGFGDVSVNSKMKELNKILYDILLKIESKNEINLKNFNLNHSLVVKYFEELKDKNNTRYNQFEAYFSSFFNYCFELSNENMIKELNKFKY